MTREISRTFEYDSRPAWNSVTVRGIEGRARATRTCSRAAPGDIEQAQASQWAVDFRPTNQPTPPRASKSASISRNWQVAPATTAAWAWILSPSASASGSDNGTAGPAEGGTGGLAGGVVVVMMGSKQGRRTSIRDQPTRPLHHTTPQATHWGQAPTGEERPPRTAAPEQDPRAGPQSRTDRKSTRLNSSHVAISYAVFCLKKKTHPDAGG